MDLEWTLVAETACFSATTFVSNYTFTAPYSGNVTAVKLVHKSGLVECNTWIKLPATNWGCVSRGYGVQLVLHSDNTTNSSVHTILPSETTSNVFDLSTFSENINSSNWSHPSCSSGIGCNVNWYDMGEEPISDELWWIDESANLEVSTEDIFSLQYGEGCCNVDTFNNEGSACAEVYFHYLVPNTTTTLPTVAPDIEATDDPSFVRCA